MSIDALLEEEKLFDVADGVEAARTLFVSAEVLEIFEDQSDTRDGVRRAEAAALLEAFVEGAYITLGEDPFDKQANAIMARVHPVNLEIFDFRCLDPTPGIRILGCFKEKDTFIALTWDYRENFETAADWEEQVQRCQNAWSELFADEAPHSGDKIDAYLSFNCKSV